MWYSFAVTRDHIEAVIKDVLRAIAALITSTIVFVAIVWLWPSFMVAAMEAGGRPYLAVVNQLVMVALGTSIGAVVMSICARRDWITPAIAGVVLFCLGLLGILMSMVESRQESDGVLATVNMAILWLSYLLVIGFVVAFRRRRKAS
jgi:hypothetical protein